MDTRFWGPSGWRLLHLITFTYEPKQRNEIKEFFSMLPFVLPCKYCRYSLTQYMKKEPIEDSLSSRATLTRWLYRIHNHVNAKLRSQGLLNYPDPSFKDVKKIYKERVAAGCIKTEFEGWDFLFSIAENHPFSQHTKTSSPMPDAPDNSSHMTPEEKNEFNLMTKEERMPYYKRFWESIPSVLPFEEWQQAWASCDIRYETLIHRQTWIKELWRIRCCLENNLDLINREEFGSLCKRLADHRSGCGSHKRGKTCRRKRITRKNIN